MTSPIREAVTLPRRVWTHSGVRCICLFFRYQCDPLFEPLFCFIEAAAWEFGKFFDAEGLAELIGAELGEVAFGGEVVCLFFGYEKLVRRLRAGFGGVIVFTFGGEC